MVYRLLPIFLVTLTLFLLSCYERKNPLLDYPASDISRWIYKHEKTDGLLACSTEWAKPLEERKTDLSCDSIAQSLALSLKDAGFGDILPEDVLLPTIWDDFASRVRSAKANTYDPEKTRNMFDSIKLKGK